MPTLPNPSSQDRPDQLADVAEMYYLQGKNQDQIARLLGVDRSTISRMLREARGQAIVEIRINRPLRAEPGLEAGLVDRFGLAKASVITDREEDYAQLLTRLGVAGANLLLNLLSPGKIIGLSWGTAVSAVVDALPIQPAIPDLKVVQLVGALGARDSVYDGRGLVQRLAAKVDGQAYFLNAPFLVHDALIARALKNTPSIHEALLLGRRCDAAILGVGSLESQFSSFYQAGYVPMPELEKLRQAGMVGDTCGLHFTELGETPPIEFHQRIVTIQPEDLKSIPVRIGVAGGQGKVSPILGALRAGYINALVTNESVARELLKPAEHL
jgi:DNA-binding transcriptional regulator LsrR (DeoR family)